MIAQKGSEVNTNLQKIGHDNDVQASKRKKTNRKLARPRFLSGR